MPYMYCNKQGCNETVKVPAQYCAKHKPKKASDLTVTLDTGKIVKQLLDDKESKTKKTTK